MRGEGRGLGSQGSLIAGCGEEEEVKQEGVRRGHVTGYPTGLLGLHLNSPGKLVQEWQQMQDGPLCGLPLGSLQTSRSALMLLPSTYAQRVSL